jgi:hypothetical protein
MAMWRFPIDVRIEREPGLDEVVDGIVAKLAAEGRGAANAPRPAEGASGAAPQPYGEVAGFPSANRGASRPWPTGNRRPILAEGNWFGGSLSGGQIFGPGEAIPPHIAEVEPIDSLDATGKRHDLRYDRLLREVYGLLENGASNSGALAHFHRGAIEADRSLAEDIESASPSTAWGDILKWGSRKLKLVNPLEWARNRQEILDRLQRDESYRRYIDSLPTSRLFDHLPPMDVGGELYRLRRADEQRELMDLAPGVSGVP